MTDLIARLEAASDGSSGLDYRLGRALGLIDAAMVYTSPSGDQLVRGNADPWPRWTTSLDAALALAERVLPGCRCMVERDHDGSGWSCVRACEGGPAIMTEAPTPTLALCIGILKAKEAA